MTSPGDGGPLGPAGDPDASGADPAPVRSVSPEAGPLDPRHDPDRFSNAVEDAGRSGGKDLTELIGKGRSFEEERNPYLWVLGLAMVLGFLAAVSLVFANLSPR